MAETASRHRPVVDPVRASREGHAYHEAWAARSALELLVPTTTLTAVAIEGFSVDDAPAMSQEATEIADLVRYHGSVTIQSASRIEVIQFKYSIARATQPLRAADIIKTLDKFARVDQDYLNLIGLARTEEVVRYELVTNRPLHTSLTSAVEGLRSSVPPRGKVQSQAKLLAERIPLTADRLASLLRRLTLKGTAGTLSGVKTSAHHTLANWGAASDSLAQMRLARICGLLREKAGYHGQSANLIRRVDILAALEVAHEAELFPSPEALPSIGITIDRPQLDTIVEMVQADGPPIMVHSAGGLGKTVLMQALAGRLAGEGEVVLFDGFGAGRWRDPADARHLPKRGFVHIANQLAAKGLCDPLLPSDSAEDLVRAFRARLDQSVSALRNGFPQPRLTLLLDAIDHCAQQARETSGESFAQMLLKSLSVSPLPGVSLVASCRTHRLDLARGDATCRLFQLTEFSPPETRRLVRAREQHATAAEIAALHGRSGGNPRVLDALLREGRPFDAAPPPAVRRSPSAVLDSLLERRIQHARDEALRRGVPDPDVDAFLAGLALMPPPVPLPELAAAQAIHQTAIESFAADLAPLLDRTPHGLIFRDEPTETLIRQRLTNEDRSREAVVSRLAARQERSSYAARALPMVLTQLGRTTELVNLAFDERFPSEASSIVAQRRIRLARLTAALRACARENRTDDLTGLLLESARVVGGNERSDRFLHEHPDLVALSGDPEAAQRLFESRAVWPGARHSALAIRDILAGDVGQARRNARRALDWLQWLSTLPEPRRSQIIIKDQEFVGPAYVELLAGHTARVARWFEQWDESHAFKLFTRLILLLECHATLSVETRAQRDRLARLAARCRLRSRALTASALNNAQVTVDEERRLIQLLARCTASPARERDYRLDSMTDNTLADALLAAALKALKLGLYSEVRTILADARVGRPTAWTYSSPWYHRAEVTRRVIWSAIHAVLEGRSPDLRDLAPDDVTAAIPGRQHYRSSAVFEAALQRWLTPRTRQVTNTRSKRQNAHDDSRRREDVSRALNYRVKPLLPFASAISGLLQDETGAAALTRGLAQLVSATSSIERYPYRDGPRYIARVGLDSLLTSGDALGMVTPNIASQLVTWLIGESPIKDTKLWIDVVAVLARRGETRDAALQLAQACSTLIDSFSDVDPRVSAYGGLARAAWRASPAEARAYFRRGLDLADAVGSNDYDRVSGLIEFARHYTGGPISARILHTFARVCEVNIPEEPEKFDWVGLAKALSRLGDIGALAILARIADREKAGLCWSLSPLLAALTENGRLDADLAHALIGLDRPAETWVWGMADYASVCLPRLQTAQRETLATSLLREVDRLYGDSPPAESLGKLLQVLSHHLQPASPSLASLARLHNALDDRRSQAKEPLECPPPSDSMRSGSNAPPAGLYPKLPQVSGVDDVDPGDPDAIDKALEHSRAEADGTDRRWCGPFLTALQERLQGPDERLRFLRALIATKVPSVRDKIDVLRDSSIWRATSVAIDDEMPQLIRALAQRHAHEMMGSDWEASYSLRSVIELSGRPGAELVPIIITALGDDGMNVSGTACLNIAALMAETASSDATRTALERTLGFIERDLADVLGDGPWRDQFVADGDPVKTVAGLLWFSLGRPEACLRWRAAHAIRRFASLGAKDLLRALVERMHSTDALPFQDPDLPFFLLHAKLWLLLALARIAVDDPGLVLPFRETLEAIAFDEAYPHVLMRHFAALALRALESRYPEPDGPRLTRRLQGVNASPYPPALSRERRTNFYSPSRPPDRPAPDKPFYFDYDFGKHDLDGLGEVFGCDYWEVSDRCTAWIRRYDVEVERMWDCPRARRLSPLNGDSWAHEPAAGRDTWGGYLAWHGLMLTAGDLLRERPVAKSPWGDDPDQSPWHEWLRRRVLSRSDGLWLSDGTDPFPIDVCMPLTPRASKEEVPSQSLALGQLVGFTEGWKLHEELIVDGAWDSQEGIDVWVRSTLVDEGCADALAFAVAVESPFHQALPREEDLLRWGIGNGIPSYVRPLATTYDDQDARLDKDDPYGSVAALRRARPTGAVAAAFGVTATDPFGRSWVDEQGRPVFRAEAWGTITGEGRYAAEKSGNRLFVRVEQLHAMLAAHAQSLVLLVKVQRYLGPKPARWGFSPVSPAGCSSDRPSSVEVAPDLRRRGHGSGPPSAFRSPIALRGGDAAAAGTRIGHTTSAWGRRSASGGGLPVRRSGGVGEHASRRAAAAPSG